MTYPGNFARMLALAVFLTMCSTPRGFTAEDVRAKPNVVVILADDLGFGDLSSYGAADLQSPHIDRLVESGVRFDSFYANCPVCSPTRASLLTGCYPELVGVPEIGRAHV